MFRNDRIFDHEIVSFFLSFVLSFYLCLLVSSLAQVSLRSIGEDRSLEYEGCRESVVCASISSPVNPQPDLALEELGGRVAGLCSRLRPSLRGKKELKVGNCSLDEERSPCVGYAFVAEAGARWSWDA